MAETHRLEPDRAERRAEPRSRDDLAINPEDRSDSKARAAVPRTGECSSSLAAEPSAGPGGVSLDLAAGYCDLDRWTQRVGKTTLLRIAAGILIPQAGTVRLSGMDPIRNRGICQRRLGYLSAGDRGLYARMTVRQHLDYWARLAYVPRQTVRGELKMASPHSG